VIAIDIHLEFVSLFIFLQQIPSLKTSVSSSSFKILGTNPRKLSYQV